MNVEKTSKHLKDRLDLQQILCKLHDFETNFSQVLENLGLEFIKVDPDEIMEK